MLKEILNNIPSEFSFTLEEFEQTLNHDFFELIKENCCVDFFSPNVSLTETDLKNILVESKKIYLVILHHPGITPELKTRIINFVMSKIFFILQNTNIPQYFFRQIQEIFTPAELATSIFFHIQNLDSYRWMTNFLWANRNLFPDNSKKIKTIGIYYVRFFNGGIERFLSEIIPIYLKLGYRVIFFTDVCIPKLEYPIPPPEDTGKNYERVVFKTPRNLILNRLIEWGDYLKKYEIDLMISHMHGNVFPPILQILFFKLFGVKTIFQFHASLNYSVPDLKDILAYRLSDALVSLSRTRHEFWKNFGTRSYYIPNPIKIFAYENFNRDTEKVKNTVLWVGRIAKEKNPFDVVPIMKKVSEKIPSVKLKIVGGADFPQDMEELQKLVKENSLEDNIEFCGFHVDVSNFYKTADVMLNTSPAEGWSFVISESKFFKLPLVCYDLDENEFMRDTRGMIKIPNEHFDLAADAIVKILSDKNLQKKLSEEAYESLKPFLNFDIGAAWEKIFNDLENNEPAVAGSFENEQIQKILILEIFKLKNNLK